MVDTNVLLDWFLNRNPTRTQRIDTLFSAGSEQQVPDVVIMELVFVLEKWYSFSRPEIVQFLNRLLEERTLVCNRKILYPSLADYLITSLSFIDCYLIQSAQAHDNLPLWTSDKKLVSKGRGVARLV
jgi:predicted nucleic-acid-binding protein